MCFIGKKRLDKLQANIDDLKASIDDLKSVEINRLRDESEELRELKEHLGNIRLRVKKVQPFEDGSVKIIYDVPSVILKKDSEGNWIKNDFFYSSNVLYLIDLKDMRKIQNILDNMDL